MNWLSQEDTGNDLTAPSPPAARRPRGPRRLSHGRLPRGPDSHGDSQPGAELLERWRWVRVPHVDVRLEAVPGVDGGKMALRATFAKSGDERRFVAFETRLEGDAALAKALVLRYRLTLTEGTAPRLALVVLEGDGGAWFKSGRPLKPGGTFAEARLSVAGLRPAAFSQDRDGTLTWDVKTRTWLGLVVDGPAKGVLEISRARFTPEPYRPTEPLRLTGDGPGVWSQSKDPAVTGTITTPKEGHPARGHRRPARRPPGGRRRPVPHRRDQREARRAPRRRLDDRHDPLHGVRARRLVEGRQRPARPRAGRHPLHRLPRHHERAPRAGRHLGRRPPVRPVARMAHHVAALAP